MYSTHVTPPAEEPVTLAEVKAHLRIENDDETEDTYLSGLIGAAREYAEQYTKRAFVTQTWRIELDQFPSGRIYLPWAPVQSISSVAYVNELGDTATVASVTFRPDPVRPSVRPAYNTDWPMSRVFDGAVTVEYVAGYGDAADVPQAIKQAMLLLIGHYHLNRESVVTGTIATELPQSVASLLGPYRIRVVA